MPHAIEKYRRKISGPIADRIDMWVTVGQMPLSALSTKAKRASGETASAREAIARARATQSKRFEGNDRVQTNADMKARDIEMYALLENEAEKALQDAAERLKLSARGYHRTIKLARTIADLAESENIQTPHMLEALQFRARDV